MTKRDSVSRLIELNRYGSVICLHGALPSSEFFESIRGKKPIIAADGAANVLWRAGVVPDFIVGDMDSAEAEILALVPHLKVEDQDTTDFQKAIKYAEDNKLTPSIVCGISGGCLDHILNNVNIFLDTKAMIYEDELVGFIVEGQRSLELPLETKISILGFPECIVFSRGLKWELDGFQMRFPGPNSCFNRTIQKTIEINVVSGVALVLVYRIGVFDAGRTWGV
ncbi:MAG: thiamine diphosphokinase [Holosporales bacterium]|jgi:thiamine pyrophosphokinase|nr:thiamine diphosphokinase [Holosporales bacterium]